MRIEIPHSSHPITRVNVSTPQGPISADFTQDHKFFDVDLPDGVTEAEVGIAVQYLNNGNQPVDGQVVKYAIEKPVDPPTFEINPVGTISGVFQTDADPADEPSTEDCECSEQEACTTCDPADDIADPQE